MNLTFVRYGGLSSVRQEGYDPSMPTYHCPPARRGIYAFVAETICLFLLGQEDFDSRRVEWVPDQAGRRICADSEAAKVLTDDRQSGKYFFRRATDGKHYLARNKKPKFFKHEGELWHHLKVPRQDILMERGSWVLTTTQTHKAAFRKAMNQRQFAIKQKLMLYVMDEFEVFIEKV